MLALLLPAAAGAFDFPLPPTPDEVAPVASYRIDARLLPGEHACEATEILTWSSPAEIPVDRLLFHLYLNAFANEASTWMREAGPPGSDHPIRPRDWGWTQVRSVELLDAGGEVTADLSGDIEYVHPDDDNAQDRTVLAVPLPAAVPPGGSVQLRIRFKSRLPRFRARTGYNHDFHFFAQWFPKIAVWEPEGMRGRTPGGWNAHQFHSFTEFYSDYGSYDVRLTVPQGWTVGATGKAQGAPQRHGDGMETWRFVQSAVHDFTWLADPRLASTTRTFDIDDLRDPQQERWLVEKVGVSEAALDLPPVEVTLLYPPEHEGLVDRQFRAVFEALRYYGWWFGPYPYETLTVLDPPHGGEGAGGMEYPTLITGGAHLWSPSRHLSPEMVLVHELGHQYWYGLVGSNEFEEAWLDEGINTYSTARVLKVAYGADWRYGRMAGIPVPGLSLVDTPGRFPGWMEGSLEDRLAGILHLRAFGVPPSGLLDMLREMPWISWIRGVPVPQDYSRRRRFLTEPAADPLTADSWRLYDRNVYRVNAYDRPATTLATLERVVGPDLMIRGLRAFHLEWRFRHPSSTDFVRTFSQAVGRDLSWFFEPLVFGVGTVDFAVGRVEQHEVQAPLGAFFEDGKVVVRTEENRKEAEGAEVWDSAVYIRRLGTARVPVTVEVHREGDPVIREEWDGRTRFTVLRYRGGKVTEVVVDPDRVWLLDLDFRNNRWEAEPDPTPALHWSERAAFWLQNLLLFTTSLT